jgi:hypothetical protein
MFRFYGTGKEGSIGNIKPSEFPATFRTTNYRHSGSGGFVCSFFSSLRGCFYCHPGSGGFVFSILSRVVGGFPPVNGFVRHISYSWLDELRLSFRQLGTPSRQNPRFFDTHRPPVWQRELKRSAGRLVHDRVGVRANACKQRLQPSCTRNWRSGRMSASDSTHRRSTQVKPRMHATYDGRFVAPSTKSGP